MKKILFFCLYAGILFANSAAHATFGISDPGWGATNTNACTASTAGVPLIDGPKWSRYNDDEQGAIALVAIDIVKDGGYFCTLQMQAANKDKSRSWTEYYVPTGGQLCFWLCVSGKEGPKCAGASDPKAAAEPQTFSVSEFAKAGITVLPLSTGQANIEDKVPHFHRRDDKCYGNRKSETDVILMGVEFLPNGHGIKAAPVAFTSRREGDKPMKSYISLKKSGAEKTLCATGFSGTGCTATTVAGQESEIVSKMCLGFDGEQYKESIHSRTLNTVDKCYDFRCKDTTKGLASTTDASCVSCSGSQNYLDSYNVCQTCGQTQYYDKTAKACREAAKYSKNDLLYGKGKGADTDISIVCWTKENYEDYQKCVKGN